MKKLLFVAAFLMATVAASAQGWWAGGGIGYFYEKPKGAPGGINSFSLAPEAGYDFNDKWGVAMAIGYSGEIDKSQDRYLTTSTHGFFIQPYVRYKFVKFGNATFFVDGIVQYGYDVIKDKMPGVTIKTDGHSAKVGVCPGFAYAFCDKAVLACRFGFLGYKHDYDPFTDTKSNGFGFDFSSYNLGLSMYFAL